MRESVLFVSALLLTLILAVALPGPVLGWEPTASSPVVEPTAASAPVLTPAAPPAPIKTVRVESTTTAPAPTQTVRIESSTTTTPQITVYPQPPATPDHTTTYWIVGVLAGLLIVVLAAFVAGSSKSQTVVSTSRSHTENPSPVVNESEKTTVTRGD